jgi:hypothetical protein
MRISKHDNPRTARLYNIYGSALTIIGMTLLMVVFPMLYTGFIKPSFITDYLPWFADIFYVMEIGTAILGTIFTILGVCFLLNLYE